MAFGLRYAKKFNIKAVALDLDRWLNYKSSQVWVSRIAEFLASPEILTLKRIILVCSDSHATPRKLAVRSAWMNDFLREPSGHYSRLRDDNIRLLINAEEEYASTLR